MSIGEYTPGEERWYPWVRLAVLVIVGWVMFAFGWNAHATYGHHPAPPVPTFHSTSPATKVEPIPTAPICVRPSTIIT